MAKAEPKSKARWFQYSLQTMLITITVLCVGLGYVVYKRNKAEGAKLAAESLKKKVAIYAFSGDKMPGEGNEWSVAILGDDSYEHMAALWIEGPQFHDADLKEVAKLRFLNLLNLHHSDVSDEGLRHISSLSQMENLSIGECKNITDEGLAHLRPLTHLKGLWLYDSSVSDEGLKNLECFGELEFLNLDRTRVTDVGLARLTKLSALKGLFVCCEGVSDAGLEKLRELKQLEELRLNDTNISDSGLVHLQELPHLKNLWLGGTRITDRGLLHLQSCKQLEYLFVAGTKATDTGVENLERKMPKLRIGFVRKNDPAP